MFCFSVTAPYHIIRPIEWNNVSFSVWRQLRDLVILEFNNCDLVGIFHRLRFKMDISLAWVAYNNYECITHWWTTPKRVQIDPPFFHLAVGHIVCYPIVLSAYLIFLTFHLKVKYSNPQYGRSSYANDDSYGTSYIADKYVKICAFKCNNYLRLTLAHCQGKGQGPPFFYSEYLRNGERQKQHYYCHQIESYVLAFDKHIHICPWLILKVKVKIMDISAVNILEMVTEAKITIQTK